MLLFMASVLLVSCLTKVLIVYNPSPFEKHLSKEDLEEVIHTLKKMILWDTRLCLCLVLGMIYESVDSV